LIRSGRLPHLHFMKGAGFLDYDFVREWVGAYDGMMFSFRYFLFLFPLFSALHCLTQSAPLSRSSRYRLILNCHPSLPPPSVGQLGGRPLTAIDDTASSLDRERDLPTRRSAIKIFCTLRCCLTRFCSGDLPRL
jgi:hypothetical protein